ncbi:MAG: hypothetical protein K0R92_2504 [Lachnospiraceae bacterium]|jgi:hypothetical protein|nr:hypothetical protein [Lachnospiraceae bacterium]
MAIAERFGYVKYALVNSSIASLRKEPDYNSELVDEALYGMKVKVLEKVNAEWYLIQTHYDYTGYVSSRELLLDLLKIAVWEDGIKKTVIHSYADVLTVPKVQGVIEISLTRGAIIRVVAPADENGWVMVCLCNGTIGYMKQGFLGEYMTSYYNIGEDRLRYNIVQTALSYYGTQYRWGGKSSLGIDCSGLCAMAYMINGIIIYRDADMKEGFPVHEIEYEARKPADLLYFPGHIAMYMGKDKYIHATAKNGSDGVVINSLNPKDKDYREDLAKSIRAVGSIF